MSEDTRISPLRNGLQHNRTSKMVITKKLLRQGRSSNGGFSRQQVELIGVEWPLIKGWMRRCIGNEVTDEDFSKFLRLKDAHVNEKPAKKKVVEHIPDDLVDCVFRVCRFAQEHGISNSKAFNMIMREARQKKGVV